jgi:cytosine/adenosine deaminase-related metal-dependent hydrolase
MILIRGGRVYDPAGDIHEPALRDVIVEGDGIVGVSEPGEDLDRKRAIEAAATRGEAQILEAAGHLVVPGFVNAHYHSYDTLVKGLIEDAPFDLWALQTQPAFYGKRSRQELRLRTLLGAMECLKQGITTVQDMCTLVPQDEETLDTIRSAYAEVGIRVVFALALRDVAELDIAPFLPGDLSEPVRKAVTGMPRDAAEDLAFAEAQIVRLPAGGPWHWAVAASGPQRSSRALLEGVAAMSERHGLPIFTHVYETKAQTAKARRLYAAEGGSMIRHMAEVGILGPRTTLAHGVWLADREIEQLARAGAGVAHNPLSNLKLKNGVAPIAALKRAGVNLAIGCDNCSCGDCQNMFQGMKMMCLLAGGSDPQPTGVHAGQAIAAATLGGAKALGLEGRVGSIASGMKADLSLIDLSGMAFQPFNSAARQLVFSETGAGVRTVLVGGRIVVREGRLTTGDETAFRAELADIMPAFRRDFESLRQTSILAAPALLEANRRVAATDVGLNRFLGGAG